MQQELSIKGEYYTFNLSPKFKYYRFGVYSALIQKAFRRWLRHKRSRLYRFLEPFIYSAELLTLKRFAWDGDDSNLQKLKEEGLIRDYFYRKNLIPIVGRTVFARRAAGDFTYTGEVDWGALGSTSTTFSNASTQLTTEVYRKQASSQAFDDNITYIDWFIASGDVANQTFREFGAFIDGSGSANSGQAFSLLNTGGWVKSGSMFISGKYTWS